MKYSIIKPDPNLKDNLMAFGIMTEEGWYPLIFECLDKIQEIVDRDNIDIQVTEIKEKYGTLRIYLSGYTDEMYDIVYAAEHKSETICEICGKQGELHKVNGWWMTRCDECLEE